MKIDGDNTHCVYEKMGRKYITRAGLKAVEAYVRKNPDFPVLAGAFSYTIVCAVSIFEIVRTGMVVIRHLLCEEVTLSANRVKHLLLVFNFCCVFLFNFEGDYFRL